VPDVAGPSVGRFGLQGGRWQDHPANTRAVDLSDRQSPDGGDEGLLVGLVQPVGGCLVPGVLYDHLFSAMAGACRRTVGGPVRRVRAAALAGNGVLFERNLRADGDHQIRAGVACVLLVQDEAYLALLGPVVAVGTVGGHSFLQPEDSPWLGDEEAPIARAAGGARSMQPLLYRTPLADSDLLAVVPADLVRVLPVWDLVPALSGRLTEVRERLEGVRLAETVSVVRIGEGGGTQSAAPANGEATGGLIQVFLREEGAPEVQDAPDDATGSRADDAGRDVHRDSLCPQGLDLVDAAEPEPQLEGPSAGTTPPEVDEEVADEQSGPVTGSDGMDSEEHILVRRWQHWRQGVYKLWRALPRPDAAEWRKAMCNRARRIMYGMEDALVRVLPDQVPERPARPPRGDGPVKQRVALGGTALMVLAMAIPLVMLGVVMATRIQYERARREQFGDIQARAQAYYDAATRAADVVTMRQGLEDALGATREGLAIHPGDEMLMSLQRRIEHRLDQVNAVERIYTFYKLAEFDEATLAMSDSSRIIVRGIDLYVLNRGSDRVYKFLMNDVGDALQPVDRDPILLRKGELYDGVQVGSLVDIVWMRAGGQRSIDTFVVLDRAGTMFAYGPQTGIDALPVADSEAWLKPEAIGGYFGNLYVLDPLLNAILKYIPTDNAYTNPPTHYLNPSLGVDLTGAVDMAVDGSMYVLFADGSVQKYWDGEPVEFSMEGLPSPMRSPTAIFVSGEQEPDAAGYVYVADAGNQRIVQFDKEGRYVRQLKAKLEGDEMRGLRGLHVDEERERILLVSDDALWYARLPALQRAP